MSNHGANMGHEGGQEGGMWENVGPLCGAAFTRYGANAQILMDFCVWGYVGAEGALGPHHAREEFFTPTHPTTADQPPLR